MGWIILLLFGIVGGLITQSKKRSFVSGLLWGILLGPIGLIVTACLSIKQESLVPPTPEKIKPLSKITKILVFGLYFTIIFATILLLYYSPCK